MAWLRWARDVIGGFAAAFLAYVVVGTFVGMVANAIAEGTFTCPSNMYGASGLACEDSLTRTVWYTLADLPALLMLTPYGVVMALTGPHSMTAHDTYYVIDATAIWVSGASFGALTLVGFFAWRTRSAAIAWLLLFFLIGEVAYLVARALLIVA